MFRPKVLSLVLLLGAGVPANSEEPETVKASRPVVYLPQGWSAEERRADCESLFFTPWHGVAELRPLGGINRMRKAVYEASSSFRHQPKEPAGR